MAERSPPPRIIKFVRRLRRRNPELTLDDAVERWRSQGGAEQDVDMVRMAYEEEIRAPPQRRAQREAHHGRIVILTTLVWLGGNLALALVLGLPGYVGCRERPSTGSAFATCGLSLGFVFLGVGLAQVVYGAIAAVVAGRARPAMAQGVLIGMGAALLLFTALCFGSTLAG